MNNTRRNNKVKDMKTCFCGHPESSHYNKFNVATLEELDGRNLKILENSLLAKLGPDYVAIPVVNPKK